MDDILDIIGKLCANNNTTIAELERNLGFARSTIQKWKQGNPTIKNIKTVADYFDVSVDYILGRTAISATADKALSDDDLITIQRLRTNLPEREKDKMMKLLRLQFEKDFPKDFSEGIKK
jgi:transcriptional regulator with XRE-family HTH domain